MLATHAEETCTRNLHENFLHKFITVICTTATGQPITLHGHMPDSFCHSPGIELCSIVCKKLVQEKTCTRLTDTCALYKFFEHVLPANNCKYEKLFCYIYAYMYPSYIIWHPKINSISNMCFINCIS